MNQTHIRLAYQFLNVTPNDSDQVLQDKYRQALLKYHPDKGGSDADLIRVRESYQTIVDHRSKSKKGQWVNLVDLFKFTSMLIGSTVKKEYTIEAPISILRRGGVITENFERIITCPCTTPGECPICHGEGYFTKNTPCRVIIPHGTSPPSDITVKPLDESVNLGYTPIVRLKYRSNRLSLYYQEKYDNFLVSVIHPISMSELLFSRQFIVQGVEDQIVLRLKNSLVQLGTTLLIAGIGVGGKAGILGQMMVTFKIVDPPQGDRATVINPFLAEVIPPDLKVIELSDANANIAAAIFSG